MTVKSGQVWAGTFNTVDATGALATPGTGPAGVLYVDGIVNAASVTITGSNPYKFSVTLPTLTAGQRVDIYITATISGIATGAIIASEQTDTSDIMNTVVEGAFTLQDVLRIMVAALAGKLDGGGTGTLTFRDLSDTLDRIIADVDLATGDRDNITLDLT